MLKIPVLYFLTGTLDQITKKRKKIKKSKSRQEKEPVPWVFPAPQ